MIFRLSQKLAKKLKEGSLPSLPLDENPYADWSAHLFTGRSSPVHHRDEYEGVVFRGYVRQRHHRWWRVH